MTGITPTPSFLSRAWHVVTHPIEAATNAANRVRAAASDAWNFRWLSDLPPPPTEREARIQRAIAYEDASLLPPCASKLGDLIFNSRAWNHPIETATSAANRITAAASDAWTRPIVIAGNDLGTPAQMAERIQHTLSAVIGSPSENSSPPVQDPSPQLLTVGTNLQSAIRSCERVAKTFAQVQAPPVALPAITQNRSQLQQLAQEEQKKLVKHITDCTAISLWHYKIERCDDNSFAFYRSLSSNLDPVKAYCDHLLKTKGRLHYLFAKICLPPIRWFIRLFLKVDPRSESGIHRVGSLLYNYFHNPANLRAAIFGALSSASTYLHHIHSLHLSYQDMRSKHPESPEFGMTLQEYIKKHLGEDLQSIHLDEATQCPQFDKWLFDGLKIRSNIPFLGKVLDLIVIGPMTRKLIRDLNLVDTMVKAMTAPSTDYTFTYELADFLRKKLHTIRLQMEGDQQRERNLQEPNAATNPSELVPPTKPLILDDHEKSILNGLTRNLLDYLPLEGSMNEADITERLSQGPDQPTVSGTLLDRAIHSAENLLIAPMVKERLVKSIEDLFCKLSTMLIHESNNEESALATWVETLKLSNALFEPRQERRTPQEAQERKNAAQNELKEMISSKLAFDFRDTETVLDTQKAKQALQLIIKDQTVQEHFVPLNEASRACEGAFQSKKPQVVQNTLLQLLQMMSAYLANLSSNLEDAKRCFGHLNHSVQDNYYEMVASMRSELQTMIDQVQPLIDASESIKRAQPHLALLDPFEMVQESAYPSLKEALATMKSALQGTSLESNVQELERGVLDAQSCAQSMKRREELSTFIGDVKGHLLRFGVLNRNIGGRPKDSSIREQIDNVESARRHLLRMELGCNWALNRTNFKGEIEELKKRLVHTFNYVESTQIQEAQAAMMQMETMASSLDSCSSPDEIKAALRRCNAAYDVAHKALINLCSTASSKDASDRKELARLVAQITRDQSQLAGYAAEDLAALDVLRPLLTAALSAYYSNRVVLPSVWQIDEVNGKLQAALTQLDAIASRLVEHNANMASIYDNKKQAVAASAKKLTQVSSLEHKSKWDKIQTSLTQFNSSITKISEAAHLFREKQAALIEGVPITINIGTREFANYERTLGERTTNPLVKPLISVVTSQQHIEQLLLRSVLPPVLQVPTI